MRKMYDPAVKFTLGSFLLLLLIVVSPAQGLRCYECTNDQPGCDTNVASSPTSYVIDCPGAVGCVLYIAEYDFFIPSLFFRSCLYEVEKSCYIEAHKPNDIDVDNPKVYEGKKYVSQWGYQIASFGVCIESKRQIYNISDPPWPANDDDISWENHTFTHILFQAELGNSRDWSDYGGPNNTDVSHKKFPPTQDLVCYSCDADFSTYLYIDSKTAFFPTCGNSNGMPTIRCKGAYGCAAFYEVQHIYKKINTTAPEYTNFPYEHTKYTVRIWRGCWYPGDQKCLRFPNKKDGNKEAGSRAISPFNKRRRPGAENSCRKAYKNGRTSKEVVVWRGTVMDDSLTAGKVSYIFYIDCMREVRRKIGVQEDLVSAGAEKRQKAGEYVITQVGYSYCGPGDNCNSDGGTTTSPAPPPTTGKEYNGTIDDKFNPHIPETGYPDCYFHGTGSGAAAAFSLRISEVSLCWAYLAFSFALRQN